MNDFKREFKALEQEIMDAVSTTLGSGWYILGEQVETFERKFAHFVGVKYAVGVANGLEALQIALMAHHIGSGDEVLTVANSAVATSLAITAVGARPVFVDIDEYGHIDIGKLESHMSVHTKAIIPVHLFGQTVDVSGLLKFADQHRLIVIEDACQAHGATYAGKQAGSFGNCAAFSFYPTKNLGAYGDAGALTMNNKELYETCKKLRNYGQRNRYNHEIKGINSRLDEVQAAILTVKLGHLSEFVKKRNRIASLYLKGLADVPHITLPKIRKNCVHSFHLFVIEARDRDGLRSFLKDNGVETQVHYPTPIHKQQCYTEFSAVSLPVTEKMADSILSLPIHPYMEDDEVSSVINLIKNYYVSK
ncbi:MAG: DegT/DnrJ/EryC1/StrS family aminotransferase [Patescibacteria group bacterium]